MTIGCNPIYENVRMFSVLWRFVHIMAFDKHVRTEMYKYV